MPLEHDVPECKFLILKIRTTAYPLLPIGKSSGAWKPLLWELCPPPEPRKLCLHWPDPRRMRDRTSEKVFHGFAVIGGCILEPKQSHLVCISMFPLKHIPPRELT